MYLQLEVKTIANGHLSEALEWLSQLHEVMARNEGFVDARSSQFLGAPGQYLVGRTWVNADAHQAYRATPEAAAFTGGPMPYKNLLVQRWDELMRSTGNADGNFLVRTIHKIRPESWDEYLESRRRYDFLSLKEGGVVDVRTYRLLASGSDGIEALVLERRHSREGYDRLLESSNYVEYEKDLPPGLYNKEFTECYEVIQETDVDAHVEN